MAVLLGHEHPWGSPTWIFKGTPVPLSDTEERTCYDLVVDQGVSLLPDGTQKYRDVTNTVGTMLYASACMHSRSQAITAVFFARSGGHVLLHP